MRIPDYPILRNNTSNKCFLPLQPSILSNYTGFGLVILGPLFLHPQFPSLSPKQHTSRTQLTIYFLTQDEKRGIKWFAAVLAAVVHAVQVLQTKDPQVHTDKVTCLNQGGILSRRCG